ncbi:hypothetical protein MSG28_004897 [Choristoneura fumiferana]|uniref:Uncharacterized protein n=1 Tax=Choristoneura fumiferana TaxID=7141 RepID=A0ACC0JP48_CHOFU|nr:hypothetical protein MSG28_004897 [Choristoneura fumiferana]
MGQAFGTTSHNDRHYHRKEIDNKSKEEKKNLSNLFKETRKSIRKDYSMHRQEVITRNLTKFRSAKKGIEGTKSNVSLQITNQSVKFHEPSCNKDPRRSVEAAVVQLSDASSAGFELQLGSGSAGLLAARPLWQWAGSELDYSNTIFKLQ